MRITYHYERPGPMTVEIEDPPDGLDPESPEYADFIADRAPQPVSFLSDWEVK